MQEFFYIIAKTVSIALEVVSFAMIIRMLLPIFIDPTESRIYAITCYVTEPFIAPVRAIMVRLNIGQDSPIDWSFFATYIILSVGTMFLPMI